MGAEWPKRDPSLYHLEGVEGALEEELVGRGVDARHGQLCSRDVHWGALVWPPHLMGVETEAQKSEVTCRWFCGNRDPAAALTIFRWLGSWRPRRHKQDKDKDKEYRRKGWQRRRGREQ